MNVGESIRKAIDDWELGEIEAAMLHACNAEDGTAKKVYPNLGSNERFTRLLRENYGIFGPMAMPGINLAETRFPVTVPRPKASGGKPDIADFIYGIHRCTHGHGDELPDGFALLEDAVGQQGITQFLVEPGKVQLSDRVIFALIAVAIFSPVNVGQSVPEGYHLTFGNSATLTINEWWGRAADFPAIAAMEPMPNVTLDLSEWTE